MMWWGIDGSWGHGWWWPVAMIICMLLMSRMMKHGGSHTHRSQHRGLDVPERLLADRLAKGEIDVTEYERLRDALQGTHEESPAGEVHTHVERLGD